MYLITVINIAMQILTFDKDLKELFQHDLDRKVL